MNGVTPPSSALPHFVGCGLLFVAGDSIHWFARVVRVSQRMVTSMTKRTDALHDSVPLDDGLAANAALRAWHESSEGTNAREPLSAKPWVRKLPGTYRPFAKAWEVAISNALLLSDNPKLAPELERLAYSDIQDTISELEGSKPEVVSAWAGWYSNWCAQQVRELATREPDLFRSEAELSATARDANAERMRRERDVALGTDLFRWLQAQPNGQARWNPDTIARALAPQARNDQLPRVKPMAEALVRLGAAEWRTTPKGRPWALRVVCNSLQLH